MAILGNDQITLRSQLANAENTLKMAKIVAPPTSKWVKDCEADVQKIKQLLEQTAKK